MRNQFKVGDRVRRTGTILGSDVKVGDIVTVREVSADGGSFNAEGHTPYHSSFSFASDYFELVEDPQKSTYFQVGDRVESLDGTTQGVVAAVEIGYFTKEEIIRFEPEGQGYYAKQFKLLPVADATPDVPEGTADQAEGLGSGFIVHPDLPAPWASTMFESEEQATQAAGAFGISGTVYAIAHVTVLAEVYKN